jgi:3-phenylpropionate/trans-cinnamate dioxygenase ferredoxin component
MSSFVKVATRGELPPGGKKLAEVDGRPIAVFNVAGSFYAIDDVCTHDGGPLAEGELRGSEIMCPRHGARFDVRTGAALCMPAIEPVAAHSIEVRGEDVYVAVSDD